MGDRNFTAECGSQHRRIGDYQPDSVLLHSDQQGDDFTGIIIKIKIIIEASRNGRKRIR